MSSSNVQALKSILIIFEVVTGLRVNFNRSALIRIKLKPGELEGAEGILNCKLGSLPLTFLGIPVGVNPRKASTWSPLINSLQKRLLGWKNKFLWGQGHTH